MTDRADHRRTACRTPPGPGPRRRTAAGPPATRRRGRHDDHLDVRVAVQPAHERRMTCSAASRPWVSASRSRSGRRAIGDGRSPPRRARPRCPAGDQTDGSGRNGRRSCGAPNRPSACSRTRCRSIRPQVPTPTGVMASHGGEGTVCRVGRLTEPPPSRPRSSGAQPAATGRGERSRSVIRSPSLSRMVTNTVGCRPRRLIPMTCASTQTAPSRQSRAAPPT